eukprot:s43_g8.t1
MIHRFDEQVLKLLLGVLCPFEWLSKARSPRPRRTSNLQGIDPGLFASLLKKDSCRVPGATDIKRLLKLKAEHELRLRTVTARVQLLNSHEEQLGKDGDKGTFCCGSAPISDRSMIVDSNQFNKLEVYVAALLENQWSDMRTPDWDQICDLQTVDVKLFRRRGSQADAADWQRQVRKEEQRQLQRDFQEYQEALKERAQQVREWTAHSQAPRRQKFEENKQMAQQDSRRLQAALRDVREQSRQSKVVQVELRRQQRKRMAQP